MVKVEKRIVVHPHCHGLDDNSQLVHHLLGKTIKASECLNGELINLPFAQALPNNDKTIYNEPY